MGSVDLSSDSEEEVVEVIPKIPKKKSKIIHDDEQSKPSPSTSYRTKSGELLVTTPASPRVGSSQTPTSNRKTPIQDKKSSKSPLSAQYASRTTPKSITPKEHTPMVQRKTSLSESSKLLLSDEKNDTGKKERGEKLTAFNAAKYPTMQDWEYFVRLAEEKFKEMNVYIKKEDLDRLYDWMHHFTEQKSLIVQKVIKNERSRDDNSFCLETEDESWKALSSLYYRLKNLILKHEQHDSMDFNRIEECNNLRKKRKEMERKDQEKSEREHQSLREQPEHVQMKFFLTRDGPKLGVKEYHDWRSTLEMGEAFKMATAEHKKDEHKLKRLSAKYKKSKENDSDDDLLNDDII